jgi:ferredoxin
MTYIIAEPCIEIKDRSCVDVCPVDCIHEFERILIIDPEECIDYGLRTKRGCRPLAVHAAWRTDAQTGVEVVLASVQGARTPEPLRRAARIARAQRGYVDRRFLSAPRGDARPKDVQVGMSTTRRRRARPLART